MNHALIEARTKDIAASGTPIAVPVAEYSNDYDITCLSYNLNDNFLGIGTTALSDVAIIQSSSTKVPSATQTTIVGIASTYRSAKILVEITPDASGDGTILSLIHI